MNNDDRRRAAEALKDLIVERKSSRWPMVLGVMIALALLGAAGYWFTLPPDQRPALGTLAARVQARAEAMINTPMLSDSKTPATPAPQKSVSPSTSTASDTGLLN